MVTAMMLDTQGNTVHPRYEKIIFDTLEECQDAMQIQEFYTLMWTTVQVAYPQQTLQQIGCGAWDMSMSSNGPEVPQQFY